MADAPTTKQIQLSLNAFTKYFRLGFAPLVVDGKDGPMTQKRVRHAKFLLGYPQAQVNDHVGHELLWRLKHPKMPGGPYQVTEAELRAGRKRRNRRHAWVAANVIHSYLKPGVTRFDGVPVAKTAVPILEWCRKHGWKGRLVSGWRSPRYSESLCYAMCGHPSCPGKCAGQASNHSGDSPVKFAVDVSMYDDFKHIVAKCPLRPHIYNALPIDPVHFSPSGR